MKRLKTILGKLYRSSWLKYGVVTLFAVVLIGFVDQNSIWNHFRNKQHIQELQEEITRQTNQYNHDKNRIKQLDTDPKAIEKIARERYFMKADDEDIFVLSDDKPFEPQPENETAE